MAAPAEDSDQTAVGPAPADTWIRRHRLLFYFALTYAISWLLFLLSRLAGGRSASSRTYRCDLGGLLRTCKRWSLRP
jgi:hypothetical protein